MPAREMLQQEGCAAYLVRLLRRYEETALAPEFFREPAQSFLLRASARAAEVAIRCGLFRYYVIDKKLSHRNFEPFERFCQSRRLFQAHSLRDSHANELANLLISQ